MTKETEHKPTALLFYLHRTVTVLWWLTVMHCAWTAAVYLSVRPTSDAVLLPFQIGVGIDPGEHFSEDLITVNGQAVEWNRFRGYGQLTVPRSSVSDLVAYSLAMVTLLGILAYLSVFWRIKALLGNAVRGCFFVIQNAIHMRWLGWSLLVVPVLGIVSEFCLRQSGFLISNGTKLELFACFPGIAVLVLGEVFLAGAKLEQDRALTV